MMIILQLKVFSVSLAGPKCTNIHIFQCKIQKVLWTVSQNTILCKDTLYPNFHFETPSFASVYKPMFVSFDVIDDFVTSPSCVT